MKRRTTITPEGNPTSSDIAARPLGMASVSEEPPSIGILVGYGLKRRARREGCPDKLDINDQIPNQTVELPRPQHEKDQRLLAAAALLAIQVRQLHLRNPRRGRYVNALQALMAGESGDVGRIAFLTTSPVEKTREELRSLADTGVVSVGVDEIGLAYYSYAESPVE